MTRAIIDEHVACALGALLAAAQATRPDARAAYTTMACNNAALAYSAACVAVPLPPPSPWATLGLRVLATRMARRGACLPPGAYRVSL